MNRSFAFATALALVAPAALAAQTCQGFASFSNGTVQLGAGIDFDDDVTIYGAGIGFGAPAGGFIRGEVGRGEDDETELSATFFGVSGGWQIGTGTAPNTLQFCPVASFVYVDGEEDVSGNELALGLSLGTAIASSPALTVVPFGTISFRRAHTEAETPLGDFESDDNYGSVDLGVGFVANEWITIRPAISIPFAEPDDFDAGTSYGVRFVFSFGKPGA
jgi:hypothetical protein